MNSDASVQRVAANSRNVTLSSWVNEPFLAWQELLSAHDVARLTRRPKWLVIALSMVGRFPARRCFHGRRVGWMKGDVLDWLAKDLQLKRCNATPSHHRGRQTSLQRMLPLHCPRVRGRRRSCASRRKGGTP